MPHYCTEVTPSCPVEATTYGYYPNLGGNIFFAVFFGLLAVLQLGFGFYFRAWTFLVAVAIGAILELVGYIGRIQMHYNPWSDSGFKTQIVCLILAPTFVAAGVYLTIKHTILALGAEHSRLKPKLFTWIFIGCDIGSIVMQAAGGGIAAAAGDTDKHLLDIGDYVMIAGIAFQIATMSICGLLALEFFVRFLRRGSGWYSLKEKPVSVGQKRTLDVRLVCAANTLAYFTVLIRCIYRLPEMAGGWGNPLMRREDEFLVLDGMMVAIAILCLTVCHPGFFFPTMRKHRRGAQVP